MSVDVLMFDEPTDEDFLRMLASVLDDASLTAQSAVRSAADEAMRRGAIGSGDCLAVLEEGVTPAYKRSIQAAMKLIGNFCRDHGRQLDDTIEIARPTLDGFVGRVLGMSPSSRNDLLSVLAANGTRGFTLAGGTAESRFRRYLDDAVRDLRSGYVRGENIRKPQPTAVSERGFRLLQAVYDELADDVRRRTDAEKVGRDVGMSDKDVRSAIAYLTTTGLLEFVEVGNQRVRITPQGIREVEDARREPNKATNHFPKGVSITIMGDNYNTTAGQVAAIGRNAHASNNTFQQVWEQSGIDLSRLAGELGRLRIAMKAESEDLPERDQAVGVVAGAQQAAIAGDGPGALRQLANAGGWVLRVAEKIGVPVAIEALKRSLPP